MGWQVPVLTVVRAFTIALLGQQGTVTPEHGHADPSPQTRSCQGPASPRKGQSQRLLVKRAREGFYPHAKGMQRLWCWEGTWREVTWNHALACAGSSWAVWHPAG